MQNEQSWGVRLWDQTSNLVKYQESGVGVHVRLQKFLNDIAKLQGDSFNAQKKICEKALINVKKVAGIETSYGLGFNDFVQAIAKLIDSENLMAVSFGLQASGEVKQSLEEERKSLKQWKQDRDRIQSDIKCQSKIIDDEYKRYCEKYRDVTRSKEDYERANEDKTCSKLDIEKALTIYSLKHAEFKRASADYVAAVEQFNMHRRYHYTSTLKHWGEAGQTLEAFRIAKTREMITVLVERLRVMIHRLTSICTDLETASVRMDAEKDTASLIERLCTGKSPPDDIQVMVLEVAEPPVDALESVVGYSNVAEPQITFHQDNDNSQTAAVTTAAVSSSLSVANGPGLNGTDMLTGRPHNLNHNSSLNPDSIATNKGRQGSSRKFSNSIGHSGPSGGHSSFLSKMFSQRSKRIISVNESIRDNPFLIDCAKPWRRSRRSKSVSTYLRPSINFLATATKAKASTGGEGPWASTDLRCSSSVQSLSKENDRKLSAKMNTSPVISRSQSQREPNAHSTEIFNANHENTTTNVPQSSDISDNEFDAYPRRYHQGSSATASLPTASSQSAPSGSMDKNQSSLLASTALIRSASSPSTAFGGFSYSKSPPPRPATMNPTSQQAPPDPVIQLAQPRYGHQGAIVGAVPSLERQPNRQSSGVTERVKGSGNSIGGSGGAGGSRRDQHQPKRHQDVTHHRSPRKNAVVAPASPSAPRGKTHNDLIVVGTCKALYDFESEQFGDSFLSFKAGEELKVISSSSRWHGSPDADGWIYAQAAVPIDDDHRRSRSRRGFIPTSFVELNLYTEPVPLSSPRRFHLGDEAATTPNSTGRNRTRGVELLALGQATDL